MAADDDVVSRALLHQGPRTLDEATYEEHARAILEQFGVAIDDLSLLRMASREGDAASEHVDALRRIAKEYVALLVRQRVERRRLFEKRVRGMPRSYAAIAAAVESQHADGHAPFRATMTALLNMDLPPWLYWEALSFTVRGPQGEPEKVYRIVSEAIRVDAQRHIVEEQEDRLLSLLRQIPEREPTRRNADTPLIHVARSVADWTKARGSTERADWQATARILEYHGWDLPGDSLSDKAQRLEDRVTRDARRHSQGTEPPE